MFFCPWETTVETIRLVLIQTPPPRQLGANIDTGKKEIFFVTIYSVYVSNKPKASLVRVIDARGRRSILVIYLIGFRF